MLGTAPAQIVSFEQARGWAEAQLATLLDDPAVAERLIGWRRAKDPAVWHTTHALTVGSFALRFTADGWQLAKLFSQATGKTMSDDEATDWATSVSRVLGKVRIIGWSPDPGTGTPGFVTLRGTGGPK
ncbi:hypothetical protein [Amycolatopsis rubida]|uniref:Uncharacterized protein n=1 Tax=Amycolatopsis rubida TaxID=112413 RepID=A0A1I5X2V7_9PSEU|nr:hypothetical protein [Amycolatopsis rubida]SFQ26270.1 hypothetical protein SAMN05421854_1105 [Amycolatopsis rubida]